jgi:hypothetical protein
MLNKVFGWMFAFLGFAACVSILLLVIMFFTADHKVVQYTLQTGSNRHYGDRGVYTIIGWRNWYDNTTILPPAGTTLEQAVEQTNKLNEGLKANH